MANTQESALHYPLGDALPEPGHTLEVAPGVYWLRMPLPFALNHINLWLLRDEQDGVAGWTVVDCGVANDATRALWQQVFATQLQGLPVLRVVCTHMHPDHIGLADWLTRQFSTPAHDCRLWISATDWNVARLASQDDNAFGGEGAAAFFASHGWADPEALAQIKARSGYYPSLVPAVPARYRRLMHGLPLQVLGRTWQCHVGYGHAPEHMALHCQAINTLIAGDMVLPRISTNVSVVGIEPEANPLPLYLQSLSDLLALPPHTLVLPSHGKPFVGLHTRIHQLQSHHQDRLAEVVQACAQQPCSAFDLLPVMFKRALDFHQTTFALGEALAHLHLLWLGGQLRRQRGADGVFRFTGA
jgi:glyoxylase-like metal-dependent hydrolase (beta-lactamase superfamily II)